MRGPRSQWLDGPMTESDYRRMMKELGAGWWNLRAAVSGPRAVVEAQLERIREVLEAAVPSGEFSALPTERIAECARSVLRERMPSHYDAQGYQPLYREYPMGHEITQEVLNDLTPWIHDVLPSRSDGL